MQRYFYRFSFLLLFFFTFLNFATAQDKFPLFQSNEDRELAQEVKSVIQQFNLLDVDRAVLKELANRPPNRLSLTLPFEGNFLTLDLTYESMLGTNFQVFAGTHQNKELVPYRGGGYYRGTIRGQEKSLVGISFFEDDIFGVIADERGNINLGLLESKKTDPRPTAIAFREQYHKFPPANECGADALDNAHLKGKIDRVGVPKSAMSVPFCFSNYLEGDFGLYQERGSNVVNATNWITGMWNVVAIIYANEQLTAEISEIFIWTSPDPYSNTDTGDALDDFRDAMTPGFNGDLAHLIARSPGGASGGVAYVDVVCTNFDPGIRTAFSKINSSYSEFPNYSWTINVLSHETGHNVGSPHTHSCAWNGNNTAIDGCGTQATGDGCPAPLPSGTGGTIMSYCHLIGSVGVNFNNGFGPQPGDLIRSVVSACSDCSGGGGGEILGCTTVGAHNYNPSATEDDGSCETCFDGTQNGDETDVDCGGSLCAPCTFCGNYVGNISLPDNQQEVDICEGESIDITFTFDQDGDAPFTLIYNNGSGDITEDEIFPNAGGQFTITITPANSNGYEIVNMIDANGCEFVDFQNSIVFVNVIDCSVPGCTDPDAHNYDPEATEDDGSCETCSDGILNGDETGVDCGGALCEPCSLCGDFSASINWTVPATEISICQGEAAVLLFEFDTDATPPFSLVYSDGQEDVSLEDIVPNNDGQFTTEIYPYSSNGYELVSVEDANGCSFSFGNQIVFVNVYPYPQVIGPGDLSDCESVTLPPIVGADLEGADVYYRRLAFNEQIPAGTIVTNSNHWQVVADNGICVATAAFLITIDPAACAIPGCTDPDSHNFNPAATEDDGSCETCSDGVQNGDETGLDCGGALCEPCAIPGCTDPDSHNFNPAATEDDGSCETCSDGVQNGDETGVDCGGALCDPCNLCGDFSASIQFVNGATETDICAGDEVVLVFVFDGDAAAPYAVTYNNGQEDVTVNEVTPNNFGQFSLVLTPDLSNGYEIVSVQDANDCDFVLVNDIVFINVLTVQTPDFDLPNELCEEDAAFALPTEFMGQNGSWNIDGTSVATFDPSLYAGEEVELVYTPAPEVCANSQTYTLAVAALGVPEFELPIRACIEQDSIYLPSVSNDGISGSWTEVAGLDGDTLYLHPYTKDTVLTIQFTPNDLVCGLPFTTQINLRLCGGDTLNIGGNIRTEEGLAVSGITVNIQQTVEMNWDQTDSLGDFKVANLYRDSSYLIVPQAPAYDSTNTATLNGLDLRDLILINRQILAIDSPEELSPYQIIAADTDGSHDINVGDIVASIQVILGIQDTFPISKSWIFVDADYVFPDPVNPWAEVFPEFRYIDTLRMDSMNNDFIGVKIGDLDATVDPVIALSDQPVELQFQDLAFTNGDQVELMGSFTRTAAANELCYFEVSYNPAQLQWNGELRIDGQKALYIDESEVGQLKIFWSSSREESEAAQLEISFVAKQTGLLSRAIAPAKNGYWIAGDGSVQVIRSNFSRTEESDRVGDFSVFPNPTDGRVNLTLPTGITADHLQVRLLDLTGRTVRETRLSTSAGARQISLDLGAAKRLEAGVYWLEVQAAGRRELLKLVVQ